MFRPQPTPFSTFYPSYITGHLDGFPPQEGNALDVNSDSFRQATAQVQVQVQTPGLGQGQGQAQGQEVIQAGGFSSYQQPSFANSPQSGAGGLEYQSGPVVNPCPGSGPHAGSMGGGASVNPRGPGLGRPGPSPGHGGAAGVAHARAVAVGGALSPVQPQHQQHQQAGPPGVRIAAGAMGFPSSSLHGAIPHSHHQLSAASASLFDHNPSSTLLRNRTSVQHPLGSLPHRHRPRPVPGTKMEPDQSLQDDLAAQEAAARTWQPELEVQRRPIQLLSFLVSQIYTMAMTTTIIENPSQGIQLT